MTVNDAVARRAIRLMSERNMTQYRLEKKSGLIHGALDRILAGKNKTVTLTTIYKLAKGFDILQLNFCKTICLPILTLILKISSNKIPNTYNKKLICTNIDC